MWVIKSSVAKMPGKCWGRYAHLALIECEPGHKVKLIKNTKKQRIVERRSRLHVGKSNRDAFSRALRDLAAIKATLELEAQLEIDAMWRT